MAATSPAGLAMATSGGRWKLAPHLDLIDKAVVDAVAGRGPKRLVVTCPPQHGKSRLLSHRLPAWYLGLWPERQVMLACYEAKYAAGWGREARDLLEEHGPELYGVGVRQDVRATDRWYTTKGGVMASSGIGGRFTGMGADLMIIDDPVKDAAEARSAVIRENHWDWWQSTASSRLHADAVVVVVMTRWHEEDLGGRLLAQDVGPDEAFTELRLPALAEEDDPLGRTPGEALWPSHYSAELLEGRRQARGTYWFAAMYQGRPAPEGGGMFERGWFPIVPARPAGGRWVRYWDLAATVAKQGSDPDWVAGALVGLGDDGRWTVADMRRDRLGPGGVEALIAQTAHLDGRDVPVWIEQEPGSSGKIVIDHYVRRVLPGFAVRGRRESGAKTVRADPVAAQAEAGNVRLVAGEWNRAFLDELEGFPTGSHDDQVDTLSGALAVLSQGGPARMAPVRLWE